MSQSNMSAFSQALFSHPSMGGPTSAALAPGMSLSAGSSPLHSPKITPHTSPAPRRRSHTPNPASYMVPTSASTPVTNSVSQPPSAGQVIQKETVGGTTYFYTDTTPAPLTGMAPAKSRPLSEHAGRLSSGEHKMHVFSGYMEKSPTFKYCFLTRNVYNQSIWRTLTCFLTDVAVYKDETMYHCQRCLQADLISLGKVVLALSCNSLAGIQRENLQKAMELVNINYSSDLKNLILYLLTDQNRLRSVNDIMPMIGARFQKDPAWSETGDRYLLKLFRDHIFHQVTEAGTPWIDLSHIVSCLNKLDAGVPEKISLISRDEKSALVVTYSDLKRCFENTFQELVAAANGQL
ncbi:hypothetical protein AB205_0169250 [Aquarana catesbeiana]|uniref:Pan3 C-terminal knob domain-containing protein n=1 Tax=Aquarana catesbeiana TaxID=8400 RepID=A0A2G9QLI6_AQUCT|nr:hypothetical protein AB205_0169250 [Aquarana catesbeiana]